MQQEKRSTGRERLKIEKVAKCAAWKELNMKKEQIVKSVPGSTRWKYATEKSKIGK